MTLQDILRAFSCDKPIYAAPSGNESRSVVMIGNDPLGPVVSFTRAQVIVTWLRDVQHNNPYRPDEDDDDDY